MADILCYMVFARKGLYQPETSVSVDFRVRFGNNHRIVIIKR